MLRDAACPTLPTSATASRTQSTSALWFLDHHALMARQIRGQQHDEQNVQHQRQHAPPAPIESRTENSADGERLAALEEEVAGLKRDMAELKQELAGFRKQFE